MTEKQLLNLKNEINEAKTKVSELTGEKQALLRQLKEEYGCKTIDEAQKKLKSLQKEIEKLEESIEQGIEELETKYDFE